MEISPQVGSVDPMRCRSEPDACIPHLPLIVTIVRSIYILRTVPTRSGVECVGVAPGVRKLRQLCAKLLMEWESGI